jgi:hypothetical protein
VSKYAANTDVTPVKSRTDIETTLTRYGASHFGYLSEPGKATVAFQYDGRNIRFTIAIPDIADYAKTATGRDASPTAQKTAHDQATRQRWRALLLVVKAKLEAVESGIAEFDQEFLPYLVLPTGRTVYEETHEQVTYMIETGRPGPLMLEAADVR